MTARETLLALAERCEQAAGPDREIDFAIFRALHPEYAGPEWQEFGGGLRHRNDSSDMRCLPPPSLTPARWTASLDAALTLVPAGLKWSCGFSKHVPHNAQVWTSTGYYEGECDSNRAIAVCIAALRARAAEAADE